MVARGLVKCMSRVYQRGSIRKVQRASGSQVWRSKDMVRQSSVAMTMTYGGTQVETMRPHVDKIAAGAVLSGHRSESAVVHGFQKLLVPANVYYPSSVRMPRELAEFAYPKDILRRRVNNRGDVAGTKPESSLAKYSASKSWHLS